MWHELIKIMLIAGTFFFLISMLRIGTQKFALRFEKEHPEYGDSISREPSECVACKLKKLCEHKMREK